MSLDGQVLCHRMLIGPVCASAAGAATAAAAPTAPVVKKARREVRLSLVDLVMTSSPLRPPRLLRRPLIIGGNTKACGEIWQLDFAIMRPFDAASMLPASKSLAPFIPHAPK